MKHTLSCILCSILFCHTIAILSAQTPDSLQRVRRGSVRIESADTLGQLATPALLTDTLRKDTAVLAAKDSIRRSNFVRRFFTKDYPKPRRAALLSLVLPGAGQAYNKRWWKIPVVWGTLGGVMWWELKKIDEFRLYRDNYKWLVDGDPATVVTDPGLVRLDATTMRANREIARQNVEYTSIVLGLAYIFTATDAFVDAHMASFDVSDDLSLRVVPKTLIGNVFGPSFGLSVCVQIH